MCCRLSRPHHVSCSWTLKQLLDCMFCYFAGIKTARERLHVVLVLLTWRFLTLPGINTVMGLFDFVFFVVSWYQHSNGVYSAELQSVVAVHYDRSNFTPHQLAGLHGKARVAPDMDRFVAGQSFQHCCTCAFIYHFWSLVLHFWILSLDLAKVQSLHAE